jgi:hypothetical protein
MSIDVFGGFGPQIPGVGLFVLGIILGLIL